MIKPLKKNKSTLKFDTVVISLFIALILLGCAWSNVAFTEERPVDFQLADELCKYYGHQEAINIISDGKKIKMMCK